MTDNQKRDLDSQAASLEDNPQRVSLANAITDAIISRVNITRSMTVLDYGAGTGLVSVALANRAGAVYAADSSAGMLAKLSEKLIVNGIQNICPVLYELDGCDAPEIKFDLIVSTMTLHHIQDCFAAILKLASMLAPGGVLAIADLDEENGEFHADHTGVFHDGFDREEIRRFFTAAAFSDIEISSAVEFTKPVEGKSPRAFSTFLATGRHSPLSPALCDADHLDSPVDTR